MNNKQGDFMKLGHLLSVRTGLGFLLLVSQIMSAQAADLAISGIDFASQAGDKLQIQLQMNGAAIAPKVFKTDNPARIAMDFVGVKNALPKKMYPVNQGGASSVYVVEAEGRVRVVVNLLESLPFETNVVGNKVQLVLAHSQPGTSVDKPVQEAPATPRAAQPATTADSKAPPPSFARRTPNPVSSRLIPEQGISGFDFKRGDNGEGRILVSLASPNTIVNSKEEGGKVVINFMNTKLPDNLAKRLDVSEFATPVKYFESVTNSNGATVTITTQNSLYDYSLFQSEGLLTVEFRPLSTEEKEALDRSRVQYTGDRLSLNFQEIEIRSVIAILSEFTGQNVVAGDDVTGTITLKLDDVPWDEALDFIMMTKGLGKFETGNVTLISPLEKIKDYKQKQQETQKVVERLEPLQTEYIKINYARAENFKNLLNGRDTGAFGACNVGKKSGSGQSSGSQGSQGAQGAQQQGQLSPGGFGTTSMGSGQFGSGQGGGQQDDFRLLSPRGSVVVDARTNTLIIRETAKRLEEAKKLIRRLDVPVRQVMIESRIVIASNTFARDLGVRFGVSKYASLGSGKVFGVGGAGTTGSMGTSSTTISNGVATTTGTPQSVKLNDMLVDLGTSSNPYGALGMTLARGADYVLNLELSALQDQGLGELVSNPRVMTSDRCQATIKQGVQIPYTSITSSSETASVSTAVATTTFVDAVLQLDVLPQITPSGSVVMALNITKDAPSAVTSGGQVAIDKREIETNVHVLDGETVVLGGIFEGVQKNDTAKVPFFADLPGIGFLFKKTYKQDDKTELLIFVTPKIVKENVAND
ncbi:MAG: type IV pilus secretin PilQ [Methylococcales bacterium]